MAATASALAPPPPLRLRRLLLLLLPLLLLVILLSSTYAAAESSPSSCSNGRARHRRRLHNHQAAPHPNPHPRRRRSRNRALLQDTKTASANGSGYSLLGNAPIALTHSHLLPGTRDKFITVSYFDASGSYPDGADADGRTIARLFDRAAFSFDVVPVATNAVCGAWTSLPDGKIGMFAGHTPMGVQPSGFDNLFVFNPFDGRWGGIEDRGGLTRGRWYPGVAALPDGKQLIYGGSGDVDFNDPAMDGDLFEFASNDIARTAPMPPFFSDIAYGPYYPLLVALPRAPGNNNNNNAVLMALNSRAGVIVPETGELLAQAPPFPDPYADLVFEYPMSGSLVMLRSDPRLASFGTPGGADAARVVIVVTGGVLSADWYREYKICDDRENYLRECSDGVLSIGLTIMTGSGGGGINYAFDEEWTVASMPGAGRCVHDAVLLPNNRVLIINGVQKGYAGLGDCQLAHDPHNEPWIFNPATNEAAPTGHTTNVPRLYHGHAALTARGDVLISGTTNTKGWTNTKGLNLDESEWGSEYRVEIYTPSAIDKKRPLIAKAPTTAFFGNSFMIETDDPISAVVLMQPGGATHGMALNQRAQDLAFENAQGANTYRVQAPASQQNAPPGHYLVFVVAEDGDTYSEGSWLLLRASADEPLQTLPVGSVKVAQASTGFEQEEVEGLPFECGAPCALRNGAASAGTGEQGARLVAGGGAWSDVLLASGNIDSGDLADLAAGGGSDGSYAYVFFCARGGGEITVAFADVAAVAAGATETNAAVVAGSRTTVYLTGDGEWRLYALQPIFLPRDAGTVRLVIGGAEADIDDVETWASGSSNVVNAAFRSALRSVQNKIGSRRADALGGQADAMAMTAAAAGGHGGVHRNERFLSPKARAFGVYA